MLKTKTNNKGSSPPQIAEFECISETTEERIAVSVNYTCSFYYVTALLEYLDLQSGGS